MHGLSDWPPKSLCAVEVIKLLIIKCELQLSHVNVMNRIRNVRRRTGGRRRRWVVL